MIHVCKRYDLEHHYYLPEYLDWLASRTEAPRYDPTTYAVSCGRVMVKMSAIGVTGRPHAVELTDFDERRLAAMDAAGVDAVFLSNPTSMEEVALPEIVDWCRKSNDAVADYARRFPGRILGAAVLPMLFPEAAAKELERCVKELGFRLWLTASNYTTARLSEPRFEPVLAKAEELRCPVYVHPGSSTDPELNAAGFAVSSSGLGFGLDTMKTVTLLLIGGLFDRHPDLRMIVGHLGEYFPFILERMDSRFAVFNDPKVTMKYPLSHYFRNRNVIVTTSGNLSAQSFMLTKEKLGIGSIVFGSDYPFENLTESVNFIESLPLTEEERRALWCGNVERLGLA